MLLGENISLALKSLISNKMRAFLTMLGIIIGIGAVIAILTVGNSLNRFVAEMMQSMGANDVFVMVNERSESEEERESTKSAIDGIRYGSTNSNAEMKDEDYITSEMIHEMCDKFEDEIYAVNVSHSLGSAEIKYGQLSSEASVRGASAGYFITNSIDILAGSMLSENDFENERFSCLVPQSIVDDLFAGEQSDALGEQIEIYVDGQMATLSIIGVYEQQDNGMGGSSMMMGMGGGTILMPLRSAMKIDRSSDRYSYFEVIASVDTDPIELSDRIKEFYAPYYRDNSHYKVAVITYDGLLDILYDLMNTITTAISIIAAFALLVGGIGVMNIMLVSVTERTREIGTRKALGARNSSIRMQFLVEATIICLIGGAIGVVFGIALGMFAAHILGYPGTPSVGGVIIALVFSISIGLFFGYFPANKAAKMNPIDALRYE